MEVKTPRINGQRIRKYLAEGKRFDGRKPEEFRELIIEPKVSCKAEGSCRVKLGKTEVIVGVKLGVSEPYPDSANKGNLMTTAEILPLSSPRIELGKPGFESIEIGRVIDRGLRESGFIDFEKLCIEEGKKVWTVFVDIYTINDDGNLMDAAGIGSVVALQLAEIPKYDEETGKIDYDKSSGKKLPLSNVVPIAISIHKLGEKVLVDPTREEEDFSETRVTVGISDGVISSMQKSESEALSVEDMGEVIDMVEKAYKDILSKIEKAAKGFK